MTGIMAPADARCVVGEREAREARAQQRLGVVEELAERAGDGVLDQAVRAGARDVDRQEEALAERGIDVGERDARRGARQRPPAAMPLGRRHEPGLTQPGHGAPNHDGVRAHARGKGLGRRGPVGVLGEVGEHVQGHGQSTAALHATIYVT